MIYFLLDLECLPQIYQSLAKTIIFVNICKSLDLIARIPFAHKDLVGERPVSEWGTLLTPVKQGIEPRARSMEIRGEKDIRDTKAFLPISAQGCSG